jgi:hypothetical protein
VIKSAIQISKNKFSGSLRIELYKIAKVNPDGLAPVLFAITDCEMSETAFKALSQRPGFKLPAEEFQNIELIARINDIKFIIGQDKVDSIRISVKSYRDVYTETENIAYLVRALKLIRKARSIFEDQLEDLKVFMLNEILKQNSSHNQLALLKDSMFLSDSGFKETMHLNFSEKLTECKAENLYTDAKNYIQMLLEIGSFDNFEYHKALSECLEKEADHQVSQKQPNTYYPTILSLYTNSLKELKGIVNVDQTRKRIERKIKQEQSHHSEMLRQVGINLNIDLDITEDIAALNIEGFSNGYSLMLELPIIESARIESALNEPSQSPLANLFNTYVYYTPKGTVSGISNQEEFNANLSRNRWRDLHIRILRDIKRVMDIDTLITKDLVAQLIERCNTSFIPADRTHLFIEGIYAGFQNDFITAAHILIPQVENSLKNIVELCQRNTTRLAEDIQNDNTLGTILELEKNGKMLDGICNRDLLKELNSFLIDNNSVNFRNQLCHGLMTPLLIDYYGIYLWWLVIKLVTQTDYYFTFQ